MKTTDLYKAIAKHIITEDNTINRIWFKVPNLRTTLRLENKWYDVSFNKITGRFTCTCLFYAAYSKQGKLDCQHIKACKYKVGIPIPEPIKKEKNEKEKEKL